MLDLLTFVFVLGMLLCLGVFELARRRGSRLLGVIWLVMAVGLVVIKHGEHSHQPAVQQGGLAVEAAAVLLWLWMRKRSQPAA